MLLRQNHALGAVIFLSVVVLHGQNIPRDEIQIESHPYVPPRPSAVRVQTNLVEIPVVVRNAQGKAVSELNQGDFEVYDDNTKQPISFFSVEKSERAAANPAAINGLPRLTASVPAGAPSTLRYVGFFFDDFNMEGGDLAYARDAAEQFIREDFEPSDRIAIFTSSMSVSCAFTDNKQELLEKLSQLRGHPRRADQGAMPCPRITPYQAFLITQLDNAMTDALTVAVAEATACGQCDATPRSRASMDNSSCPALVRTLAHQTLSLSEKFSRETLGIITDVIQFIGKMPGRRMLMLTSSGFLTQTLRPEQEKVLREAIRSDVVINTLDAKGLYVGLSGGNPGEAPPVSVAPNILVYRDRLASMQQEVMEDPLALFANETGGRFFHNSNDLGRGFRELVAVPEVSYVVGFSPENVKQDGGFHSIKVKLINERGFTTEARRGYFAPNPVNKSQISTADRLERVNHEVLATDTLADFPANVSTQSATLEAGDLALKVTVHLDIHKLPFQKREDRSVEELICISALFDAKGNYVTGVRWVVDLALKEGTLARLMGSGLTSHVSLQAPAGIYRLRTVVQEAANGSLAATSQQVEIR